MPCSIVEQFGNNNEKIVVFKLTNSFDDELIISNYGATIMAVKINTGGKYKQDIVLGFDDINDFINNCESQENAYIGSTVGRYANRIAKAKFSIDNETFQLTKNEGENHLHGGFVGLHKVVWIYEFSGNTLILKYLSVDGEEGYPGNLDIKLSISFNDEREIQLDYSAETNKPTPINLTNHLYFNLNGGEKNILDHQLTIDSKYILEKDNYNIPTGKIQNIRYTDFDFLKPAVLKNCKQMQLGYDHTFVLEKENQALGFVARIEEENNPISIEMYTTEPSLQLYTANAFTGNLIGKYKKIYKKFYGLCLEAQNFPDAPNHNSFPNSILYPEEKYKQKTIYKVIIQQK